MRAWFLSDLHLKELNERNGNILLRFLLSISEGERQATHLFLLGDVFDLWVGNHEYYYKKFQPIIDALVQIKKKGVEVFYFEGNHDVHVIPFWQTLGIHCFVEDQYVEIGGLTLRLSHGDLMNPEDTTYLRYRSFIRKNYMEPLAHIIPPRPLEAIGKIASRQSRKRSQVRRQSNEAELVGLIHQYAENSYRERPFDLLVSGHMHVRDDWTSGPVGRQFRSVNLGSWFDKPAVFWCETPEVKSADLAGDQRYESGWVELG